ncbi:MAG: hypothetical protein M3Y26_11105 [Actinomycetota bacterium]|nr:hypothetical protein [Actinomycetota bacterium]
MARRDRRISIEINRALRRMPVTGRGRMRCSTAAWTTEKCNDWYMLVLLAGVAQGATSLLSVRA